MWESGIITAAELRSASLVAISVLLVVMAAFILLSKKFGAKPRAWAVATLSITTVSWLLRIVGF